MPVPIRCLHVLCKEHGDTALHIAARQHNVEIGRLLAEHSADVNRQNVCSSGHLEYLQNTKPLLLFLGRIAA